MDIQKIKQKLHEAKNRIGLVGGSLQIQEYDQTQNNVAAHISPEGWNIEINLRKGFNPVNDKRQKAYARKKKISDGLETLLTDVLYHECGHWELPVGSERGCPFDVYDHDKILESIKEALPKEKKGLASYVANAFEDVFVNARAKEFKGDFSGQVLFWDNEGLHLKETGQKNYTPFYEAFVKLNMHLIGSSLDTALLKRHYSNAEPVETGVQKVINDLNLPEDVAKSRDGTRPLFVRKHWPRMASAFTRDLAHLLEQSPTERLSAFGNGQEGEGSEDKSQPQSGNGVDQGMKTPDGVEAVSYGRYAGGEKQSSNFTNYEQLDSVYRKLAKDIAVKVDAMTRTRSLPIAPLTYRGFDEEKDDPAKIKASKIILSGNRLTFGYSHEPLVVEARFKQQRKSFPDFKMIVLDSSGSMALGLDGGDAGNKKFIPWGDKSKYHFALLGYYGTEGFLQRQGISPYIRHGVSLFSTSTRYKEADYNSMQEVRRLALSPDFGGDTRLDAKILTQAMKGRQSFVLSLSDGEIGNWGTEKAEVARLASQNYYAHIHLGSKTQFTRDLEGFKLPVFYVKSGDDLAHLMVDITKKQYERFTKI